MTPHPHPLRGEVWDAELAQAGQHPVVILTIDPVLQRSSATTGVLITGTPGPRTTHIPLGLDAGLTRYDESYAVATELHNIPLIALTERRGLLHWRELAALGAAIRVAHGLIEDDL